MTIKPAIALVKKELIEHKGALFIAPLVLNILFFVLAILSLLLDNSEEIQPAYESFIILYSIGAVFYALYLIISLFFYYADAFCSDSRNNNMLFWKSLPISDLKILGLKLFTGTIITPIIIVGWILCAALLSYIIGVLNFTMFSSFLTPWAMIAILAELIFHTTILLLIWSLWLVPFYAWVALLSVFFKKWSIALAFIIPMVLVAIEKIFTLSMFSRSILDDFLTDRMFKITNNETWDVMRTNIAFNEAIYPEDMRQVIWGFISQVNWLSLIIGLFVAAGFIYIASEYRKRFIQG